MDTRKFVRILSIVFALLGLAALCYSMLNDRGSHSLTAGLAMITTANILNGHLNRKRQ